MEQTLLAVSVARQARKRKNIQFESEIRTAVYTEGTLAENEVTNIVGKLAAPTSFQVDFTTEEEQTSIYSHLGESYYVVNGDVEKLDGDENEELLNSLNLDQITKNNFERLMIYAEEMNFTTNGNLTTISLPTDITTSEYVRECVQDIEKKDKNMTIKAMKFELAFDENFDLVSFYTLTEIGLREDDIEAFKLINEVKVKYASLNANEDFSIPKEIIEAAK